MEIMVHIQNMEMTTLQPSQPKMFHRNLPSLHEARGSLAYSVCTSKALRILLTHKIRDARLQHLLALWTFVFMGLTAVGVCGMTMVPPFWAVGAFAPGMALFALFLSIGAGDLFLQFALEDERFFEMATETQALSVFQDDESLSQPLR
jgi:hypothetical protein